MARTNNLTNFLTDIADAIREKKGTEETIQASDFDTEIANLPSGGTTPTKGFTIDAWSNDGYPTKITTYGYTAVDGYMFNCYNNTAGAFTQLQEVNLNNEVTLINTNAFNYCSQLRILNNVDNVYSVGAYAFLNCTNLEITKLPGVTEMWQGAFRSCGGIKKISMESLVTATNTSTGTGNFANCSGLKKVWFGSSVTTLGRYTFHNCSNMQNIYIDLPRATVEAMANYSYAFSNNAFSTDVIICNDDEDFITKEEFDALVVE